MSSEATGPGALVSSAARRSRRQLRGGTGLVATVMVVVAAGVFLGVRVLGSRLGDAGLVLASLAAAAAFVLVWAGLERLVYRRGVSERPTPYSVLAAITAQSGVSPDDVPDLARLTETIGRGLGARVCRLTVYRPGLRDRTQLWTDPSVHGEDPREVEVPVRYRDEQVGVLAVDRRAVSGWSAGRRARLVDDLAAGLGAVLAIGRYSVDLERQLRAARAHAEQIAQARRAAVAEMDHERRTIETDLHDGVQHHLVSLRLALGLVELQISSGELDRARERLPVLQAAVETAENALADVTAGVATLVLREHGLVPALEADLAGDEPAVDLLRSGVDPARRYPDLAEQTVYFCCLEAVNNARKHASGSAITVELSEEDELLRFVVRDRGPGFTTDAHSAGRGLRNLTVRAAAAGGGLSVTSVPGSGTTVEGFVPVHRQARGTGAVSHAHDDGTTSQAAGESPSTTFAGGTGEPGVSDVTAASSPPRANGPLEEQVRSIAHAAAAACTEPPPRELEGLLAGFDQRGGDGGASAGSRRERARSTLLRIEALLPTLPIALEHAMQLGEQLERLRIGAHEMRELELLEALEHGMVELPASDLDSALRLLGASGTGACARLGLESDATRDQLEDAAQNQLAAWEARAQHPTANRSTRWAAEILIRTCEDLVASSVQPRRSPPPTEGECRPPV